MPVSETFKRFLWDQMRTNDHVAQQVRAMQVQCQCGKPDCHVAVLQRAGEWLRGRDAKLTP